ncbi:putative RNA-directed DNA polymerase [Helianthus debilis subsp. tardiflorus]
MRLQAGLLRRFYSFPLGFKVPKEEWKDLKVFRCNAYVRVQYVDRDKLDLKSKNCTFNGYPSENNQYIWFINWRIS